jgi:mannose-6-phosphate isomerase-like protein (cupin superfamily)
MTTEKFSTTPAATRVEKPWGYEIIWTHPAGAHTGKILFVRAGKRLSLQYHDAKEETLCLLDGEAIFHLEDAGGEVRPIRMVPRQGYAVAVGQKHRIEAVTDSTLVEVSDPEKGNTFRIEDDYARGIETESDRARERGVTPTDV